MYIHLHDDITRNVERSYKTFLSRSVNLYIFKKIIYLHVYVQGNTAGLT